MDRNPSETFAELRRFAQSRRHRTDDRHTPRTPPSQHQQKPTSPTAPPPNVILRGMPTVRPMAISDMTPAARARVDGGGLGAHRVHHLASLTKTTGFYNPQFSKTPEVHRSAAPLLDMPEEEEDHSKHLCNDMKYLRDITRYKLSGFPAAKRFAYFK
eukprot:NODE_3720_length_739_cov_94.300000_g3127_i0.p1 GENE.NODE_3720_length_739_cov_94.300000_g3127_i0~~NODE_3720_length_739_cov_94.300000_g3127_i0.p1  ORF type:complete len:157 (-),score=24.85 NODE_3720_length_739_cov_94.300000_g3127_i0:157-627(-)